MIIDYLEKRGKLNITGGIIITLYSNFSRKTYNVDWQSFTTYGLESNPVLDKFAIYLSQLNI